jgi:hypothetical protein
MPAIGFGSLSYQAFRQRLEGKGVALKDDWWGMATMIVEDPDGNELFFPVPDPTTEDA